MIQKGDVYMLSALDNSGFEVCLGVFASNEECMDICELTMREEAAKVLSPGFVKLIKSTDGKAMKLWGKSCFVPAVIVLWIYVTKNHPVYGRRGFCPTAKEVYEDAAEAIKARDEWLAEPGVDSVDMVTVPLYKHIAPGEDNNHLQDILRQLRDDPNEWS
ncbi:MAG: hypothetical protein RDU24_12885 [Humidesulfovibrio sp.]|uniref:hypothetical protein n=1 Tax=Humidesulfovibrio sp. TaxID=2910988 RepID=UPI0027F36311|nr:hypothetical protein [Humidesulfovibrio sp.]MDQ7836270.1 hypothetical protein [Humidesulfovibrio sp.]